VTIQLIADGGTHVYVSTACLHGLHDRCGVQQLGRGDLSAPHCKYCDAVCACTDCDHRAQERDEESLLGQLRAAATRTDPVPRPVIT